MRDWIWIYRFKTADGFVVEEKWFDETPTKYRRPMTPSLIPFGSFGEDLPKPEDMPRYAREYVLRDRKFEDEKHRIGIAVYEERI